MFIDLIHNDTKIRDYLISETFKIESISVLGFALYALGKFQNEFWRDIVIMLLLHPLCYLEGAYSVAFFHVKEEVRLNRNEHTLTSLLFFYDIPEKLLSKNEAIEIAKEIILMNPNNSTALAILNSQNENLNSKGN